MRLSIMSVRRGRWIATSTLMLFATLLTGCGNGRTVLVQEGSPVKTGPDCRGRVYSMVNGEWVLGGQPVNLPEGWYLLPPSFVHPESGPPK